MAYGKRGKAGGGGTTGKAKSLTFAVNASGTYSTAHDFASGNNIIAVEVAVTTPFNASSTLAAIVDSSAPVTLISAAAPTTATTALGRLLSGATEAGKIKVTIAGRTAGEATVTIRYADSYDTAASDSVTFVPKTYWSGVEDFLSLTKYVQDAEDGSISLNSGSSVQITTAASASEAPDIPRAMIELDPSRDFLAIGHIRPQGADHADGQHIYFGYADTALTTFYACISNRLDWAGGDNLLYALVGPPPLWVTSPRSAAWWMLKRVGTTLTGGVIAGALGAPPVEGDFTNMGDYLSVPTADQYLIFANGNNWSTMSVNSALLDYLSVAYS